MGEVEPQRQRGLITPRGLGWFISSHVESTRLVVSASFISHWVEYTRLSSTRVQLSRINLARLVFFIV